MAVAISTDWFIGTNDSLAIKIASAEMGPGKNPHTTCPAAISSEMAYYLMRGSGTVLPHHVLIR